MYCAYENSSNLRATPPATSAADAITNTPKRAFNNGGVDESVRSVGSELKVVVFVSYTQHTAPYEHIRADSYTDMWYMSGYAANWKARVLVRCLRGWM